MDISLLVGVYSWLVGRLTIAINLLFQCWILNLKNAIFKKKKVESEASDCIEWHGIP